MQKDISAYNSGEKTVSYGLITVALITLFNPNINIVDVLPDFIGYFILARVFERAAVASPYFEEARSGFIKAAWVSLIKIPAFVIMLAIRSANTQNNDVVALFAFVFAVVELILLIPAIKNIFSALGYLGERTDATSLINGKGILSLDSLRSFSFFFLVTKCIFYALPEALRLTRTVEIGSQVAVARGSKLYPYIVVLAVVLGLTVGGVWLFRMIKFIGAVKREGKFDEALNQMIDKRGEEDYLKRIELRGRSRGYLAFTFAAILSFELVLNEYKELNLIPHCIMGACLFIGFIILSRYLRGGDGKTALTAKVLSAAYILTSLIAYICQCVFINSFGYSALYYSANTEAHKSYLILEIFSLIEFIALTALCIAFFLFMKKHLEAGITEKYSDKTSRADLDSIKALTVKTVIITAIMFLLGLSRLLEVIFRSDVRMISTGADANHATMILASSVPWFNLVVTGLSVVYVIYSFYYFNTLKEEKRDK